MISIEVKHGKEDTPERLAEQMSDFATLTRALVMCDVNDSGVWMAANPGETATEIFGRWDKLRRDNPNAATSQQTAVTIGLTVAQQKWVLEMLGKAMRDDEDRWQRKEAALLEAIRGLEEELRGLQPGARLPHRAVVTYPIFVPHGTERDSSALPLRRALIHLVAQFDKKGLAVGYFPDSCPACHEARDLVLAATGARQ